MIRWGFLTEDGAPTWRLVWPLTLGAYVFGYVLGRWF